MPSTKDSLYDTLGVARSATPDEIRKAMKDAARTHHPDKGGDEETFKKMRHAYEVLSDPARRETYDNFGTEDEDGTGGGMGGMGAGMDMFNMFAQMGMGGMGGFGGMGAGMGAGGKRKTKGPNQDFEHRVSLSEFYHGKTHPLTFNQKKFCSVCTGHGGTSSKPCGTCKGHGVVTEIRQIGPGMMQQSQGKCRSCDGNGKIASGKCGGCSGRKFIDKHKTINIVIKPGMSEKDVIIFPEECSDNPGVDVAGDIVIHIKASPDPVYTRTGADLHVERTLTLAQALMGFRIELPHPRGSPVVITHAGPVQPNQILSVADLGMPILSTSRFGRLILTVRVALPTEVTSAQRALFASALGTNAMPVTSTLSPGVTEHACA